MSSISSIFKASQRRGLKIVKEYFSGDSLKSKAASGGIWLGIASGAEQIFRLIRNMILARLLLPDAFGLMAIAISINAAFESFTQIGIKEAIIQNQRGQEGSYLNGAWWLSVGRALIIYGIIWFSAPWISNFYANEQLLTILRVVFLSVLLNGLLSPQAYVSIKEMKFKKWVAIFHGGAIIGILSAVILAFLIPNVWALVIGFMIEAATRCILSYVICPFCPNLKFNKENLRSLLNFSKGMFGLPILTFIYMNIDIFIIGKILQMEQLGLYSLAAGIAWMPFQFMTSLIGQIMLPAFSKKQADFEWINKWTLNLTVLISFVGFPLLISAIFFGKEILTLIYGTKYGVVSIPFAIIFANALMRTVSVPIATAYIAIGQPNLHRLFTGVRTVIIVILIWPAINYFGLVGAATSGLIAMLIGNIIQAKRMNKITGLPVRQYFEIFPLSVMLSFCIFLFGLLSIYFNFSDAIYKIVICILGCVVSYVVMILYFLKSRPWRFKDEFA